MHFNTQTRYRVDLLTLTAVWAIEYTHSKIPTNTNKHKYLLMFWLVEWIAIHCLIGWIQGCGQDLRKYYIHLSYTQHVFHILPKDIFQNIHKFSQNSYMTVFCKMYNHILNKIKIYHFYLYQMFAHFLIVSDTFKTTIYSSGFGIFL